jgi:fatty acid amide hydrolase
LTELAIYHDYYMLWNFCHFPAGVIPVTQVRADEGKGTYIADTENRWLDKTARLIQKSEVGSEGMPLCVQVVTQQYRDEECLGLMKIVDDAMGHFRAELP